MSMSKAGAQLAVLAAVLSSGAAFGNAYDPGHWNMPVGASEISHNVYDLHMLIFWVCVGIGVLVFGVMFYSVFAHRRSRHPKPADFHESTSVEIMWTIVPFAILILMAIPAAGTLIKMEDTRGADLSIKITGYQWKWNYSYIDKDVSFFSTLHADSNRARQLGSGIDPNSIPNYLIEVDNRLVVPTGKKLRFLITGNDVIHAWWVPDFAIKKDAIPGYVNEAWTNILQPGIYRGVCAELCGRDHGFMPIVVEAVDPKAFEAWLADTKAGKPTAIGHGPGTQVASNAAVAVEAGLFPARILFANGAKALDANGEILIQRVAEYLKTHADAKIEVTGTKDRARLVRESLHSAGVAEDRWSVKTSSTAGEVELALAGAAAPAVAAAPAATAAPAADGQKVYDANCAACHQPAGQGMPPNFPALAGSKVVNGPADAHILHALKGKNLMPPFAHLSDADLAAAISYERTSWGNKGGAVTPEQVKAQRGK